MDYRREIDGLRAVAVLAVIPFHAGFAPFTGGFIGVDVFFVISGFLITTIIQREIVDGRFSIVGFYERRARRILPALFFIVACCFPFAWFWMLPNQFESFVHSVISVAVFGANFHFWRESGYFETANELKPLLHTWSLAVEEQFYIVFPLFLLFFRKFRRFWLILAMSVGTLGSLALAEIVSQRFPSTSFYLLPTRAWELGVGAILALVAPRLLQINRAPAEILTAVGAVMIVAPIFLYDRTTPFPGIAALAPVLGAALLIAFASPRTFVGKVLGAPPLVGVGLVSYSAYLWHQPLFAFARIRYPEFVNDGVMLGLSVATIGLAFLTWRYIEQPFRNRKRFGRRPILIGAAVASSAFIVSGFVASSSTLQQTRFPEAVAAIINAMAAENEDRHKCMASDGRPLNLKRACVHGGPTAPTVALLGDSHASALAGALGETMASAGRSIIELTFPGCPPVRGIYPSDRPRGGCAAHNQTVTKYLKANPQIDTLVVASRWSLYLNGDGFDNGEGGVEHHRQIYALPVGKGRNYVNNPKWESTVINLHRSSIEYWLADGRRVILVYPIPPAGWDVPTRMAQLAFYGRGTDQKLTTSYARYRERVEQAKKLLDAVPDHPNLHRVRPSRAFCNQEEAGRCMLEKDGAPLYLDDDHPSRLGASLIAEQIMDGI